MPTERKFIWCSKANSGWEHNAVERGTIEDYLFYLNNTCNGEHTILTLEEYNNRLDEHYG